MAGWSFHFANGIGFGIAYAAHLAYGVPMGLIVQRAGRWDTARRAGRWDTARRAGGPAWMPPAGLAVGLVAWLQPFGVPDDVRTGRRVAAGASAVVVDGRFVPE